MTYSFSHLSNGSLVEQARGHLANQRASMAALLAVLAGVMGVLIAAWGAHARG